MKIKSDKSKISIIIPIYNEEKYIKDCLESILSSDYNQNSIEILIVDGGSEDKSLEIIEEYKQQYCNIRLFYFT